MHRVASKSQETSKTFKKTRGVLEVSAFTKRVSLNFTELLNMSIRIQTARPNIKLVIFFIANP